MKALGKKFPKIIFFTADMLPTDEEITQAEEIGAGVVFRNSKFVPENPNPGQIEECEGVAGMVPESYAKKYKTVGKVVKAQVAETQTPPAPPAAPAAPEVPAAPPAPPAPASNEGWGATPPAPPAA